MNGRKYIGLGVAVVILMVAVVPSLIATNSKQENKDTPLYQIRLQQEKKVMQEPQKTKIVGKGSPQPQFINVQVLVTMRWTLLRVYTLCRGDLCWSAVLTFLFF